MLINTKLNSNLLFTRQQINFFLKFILVFFLLFSSIQYTFSQSQDSIYSSILELEITHNLGVELSKNSPSAILNQLLINSHYVLLNISPYQVINNIQIAPSSIENEVLTKNNEEENLFRQYTIINENVQDSTRIDIQNKYILTSTPFFPKINSKQTYPLSSSQIQEHSKYLQFSDMINTNSQLQEKAFELAQGEDDVFVIATKVANWLEQEIEYDLSTIFENPNQNAVEIFNSKRGVCKELSIIYISMLRSLQIPARMALGYSYTTSQEIVDLVGDNWGGHAWVEVLIGDEWVPFDLAYRQYGYVGSTHLLFQRSADINELGISVEMSSFEYEFVQNSLTSSMNFNVLEQIESYLLNEISIQAILTSQEDEYQSGSYVFLEATITNPHNHYIAQELQLIFPQELIEITPSTQLITLTPNSQTHIGYILQIPEDFNNYIFPISLYSISNLRQTSVGEFRITSRQRGVMHTKEYVELQFEELKINNNQNNNENTNNQYNNQYQFIDNKEEDIKEESKEESLENLLITLTNTIDTIVKEGLTQLNSNEICNYSFIIEELDNKNNLEEEKLYLECDLNFLFSDAIQNIEEELSIQELENIVQDYEFKLELCSTGCTSKIVRLNELIELRNNEVLIINQLGQIENQLILKTPTSLYSSSILRINSNSKPINKEIDNFAQIDIQIEMNQRGNLELLNLDYEEFDENIILVIQIVDM
ncbi:MAG: transglutaminase-like domain-containing protein [Nanoarchaeota archaeon]|nr:transglutaminase-like domain-containing protein [Nanoarchaeota archaeon]